VPVRIVYLDRSQSDPMALASAQDQADQAECSSYDFVPEACQQRAPGAGAAGGEGEGGKGGPAAQPLVQLLYRPGHYDILYGS
jgi:hypothetical protein